MIKSSVFEIFEEVCALTVFIIDTGFEAIAVVVVVVSFVVIRVAIVVTVAAFVFDVVGVCVVDRNRVTGS